jgi:hypothetical protein
MNVLYFLLAVYFAMVLGTSGLAKIDSPAHFATVLRHQQLVPDWSFNVISKFFPYLELILSFLILASPNIFKPFIVFVVFILFLMFSIIKLILFARGQSTDCGCYGKSLSQKIENSGIVVSFVQVILALFLFVLTLWLSPLPWIYYGVSALLFAIAFCWLTWRTWQRHVFTRSHLDNTDPPLSAPVSATK